MSKTIAHKRAQRKTAGKSGRVEVPLRGGKILDSLTKSGQKAGETERSGNMRSLMAAAKRLKIRRSRQKVLQVPQKDMGKASQAMKKVGVRGTVKNMSGSKRRSVR